MTNTLEGIKVLDSQIEVQTRGKVIRTFTSFPICVPVTIIPFRGRFAAIPEIITSLVGHGFKPGMLSSITVKVDTKT